MTVYLDTETTGLSPARGDTIVEIAIVDTSGTVLLDTLVNPSRPIPWQASRVHGITDDMVRGRPRLAQVMPRVLEIVASEQVVIYNAAFDAPFFPGGLREANSVECAMKQFANALGGRWRKLDVAAEHVGHRWTGVAHRALADTLACRSVWHWLVSQGHATCAESPRAQGGAYTRRLVRCPACQQSLRVPSGKRLNVTCQTCRRAFRVEP